MKFSDENGYLKLAVCALFLCCHHGLRDYFITALPLIASEVYDNSTSVQFSTAGTTLGGTVEYSTSDTYFESCHVQLKEEWTSDKVGLALSVIHWTWIIPLVLSPFIIHRIPENLMLSLCLTCSCSVAVFSDLALKSGGTTGLIILRGIQGLFQGCCYPIVYLILLNTRCTKFVFPYFLIFLAPWLGTSLGMLMGETAKPFLGCYIFSALSFSLALVSYFIPLKSDFLRKLPNLAWKETLSSLPVWSCMGVQIGGIWALHTFLVGMNLTLDFKLSRNGLFWAVFIVVAIGGVTTRLLAHVAMGLMRHHFLSALNRRRVVIMSGNILIVLTLLINGIIGIRNEWSLFVVSLLGLCFGTGLCIVGVRLNLHDLGPSFPGPFLHLGAVGAAFGAALASLLFPIISQVDCGTTGSVTDMRVPYLTAWLVPIAVVLVVGIFHFFTLSVNPLPHQIIVHEAKTSLGNGITLSFQLPVSRKDSDAKSFKSIKSALTYKTAVSRTRTRTISLKTVQEDNDDDVYSVAGSEEYKSAYPEDDDADMRSVKSGVTFKTACDERTDVDKMLRGVIINVEELDRTNEWLKTHHNIGKQLSKIIAEEKEKVEKSILLALQW